MEYLIYAGIGLIVIAAVALPLVRGREATDASEFATGPVAPAPDAVPVSNDAALESEIARYRASVAAGTVCKRCGEANGADAKFCADCGKPLERSAADAQEYA